MSPVNPFEGDVQCLGDQLLDVNTTPRGFLGTGPAKRPDSLERE